MNSEIISQMQYFAIYILCGISIGILFDIFRILRKSFKTPDFVTYIEDAIFGIITGIFLIFIIFIFNNGELRFYIFLALLLGNVLYLSTISKYFTILFFIFLFFKLSLKKHHNKNIHDYYISNKKTTVLI